MLGELIYEETGTVTGTRVVESSGDETKVEVDLQTQGSIQGVNQTCLWTYWSITRADGSIHGEGLGIMTTEDGDVIRLKGSAVAQAGGPGSGIAYRGSIYFHTTSPRFSHLNSLAGVHEYDVGGDGNTSAKVFEWK